MTETSERLLMQEADDDLDEAPRDPLSAAVMLDKAAELVYQIISDNDGEHEGEIVASAIRALSTEISEAKLDAAALARPKVQALVEALGYLVGDMVAEDHEDFASVNIALAALSALAQP